MKLTPTDKEMFKALSNSSLGELLIDYCKRLNDHICDARSWDEEDTKESTTRAALSIEEHLISKINAHKTRKEVKREVNSYL